MIQIPHNAVLSGLFGTAASVFGKFISYSDEVIENLAIDSSQNVCSKSGDSLNLLMRKMKYKLSFLTGISMEMVIENPLYHINGVL